MLWNLEHFSLVTSVLHCRFHDNIHVIKFSFLQGWLLSNDDPNKLQVWMEGSECSVSDEYVRNIKTCLVVFFVLWLYWVHNLKKKKIYKTLNLSLQKIFSLFIKRSGNRKNAPKRSCMYICTFQDINKQTHFQWHFTSYHNYPFYHHPQVIVYVTYLKS